MTEEMAIPLASYNPYMIDFGMSHLPKCESKLIHHEMKKKVFSQGISPGLLYIALRSTMGRGSTAPR